MHRAQIISQFLRSLAAAVEGMSDNEIDDLLRAEGVAGLTRRANSKVKRKKSAPPRAEVQAEARYVVEQLAALGTRDEATRFLEEQTPTRSVLAQAAKLRQIHVAKEDTNSLIKQKLVEHIVGSKLDSAAIRGG